MKLLKISAKCSDLFNAKLFENNIYIGETDGYVPQWFPNPKSEHYGDYIDLEIDLESGKILNWKSPTQKDLNKTFKKNSVNA